MSTIEFWKRASALTLLFFIWWIALITGFDRLELARAIVPDPTFIRAGTILGVQTAVGGIPVLIVYLAKRVFGGKPSAAGIGYFFWAYAGIAALPIILATLFLILESVSIL